MNSAKPIKPTSIRQKTILRRKLFWAIVAVVIVLGGGAGWYFLAGPGNPVSRMPAAGFMGPESQTTPVQRGDVMLYATGSGTLIAGDTEDLIFSTSGVVTDISVALGDYVEAGDVLAQMGDSITLEANLTKAELQLLEARQELEDLQKNSNLNLAQAYSDWITAQQNYADALETSQKMETSRCSQEVSTKYKAALDRATQKLEQVTAQVETKNSDAYIDARSDYDTALANYTYCASYTSEEITSADSELDLAKINMEQAEETYNTLKENSGIDPDELKQLELSVENAENQVAAAQEKLDGLVLTAPISGKVVYIAGEEGEIAGTSVFITIADVAHPGLEVSVDESDLDKVAVGNAVTVTFDALPDQVFNGTVTEVNPQMVSSGMYQVIQGTVELDEEAARTVEKLPIGMSATVTVISEQVTDALIIPLTALQKSKTGEYSVNLVDQSGNLTQKTVTVGIMDSTQAEITSGLEEGDIVSTMLTENSVAGTESDEEMPEGGMMPAGGPPGGGTDALSQRLRTEEYTMDRKPKTKKRKGLGLVLLVMVIVAGIGFGIWQFFLKDRLAAEEANSEETTSEYQTSDARRGEITLTISGTGTVETSKSADMTFSASGNIAKMNVQAGDVVTEGQELAVLDNIAELELAIKNQELAVQVAQNSLGELTNNAEGTLAQALIDKADAEEAYEEAQANLRTEGQGRCESDTTKKYYMEYLYAQSNVEEWQGYLTNPQGYGKDFVIQKLTPLIKARDAAYANWNYCQTFTEDEIVSSEATLQLTKAQFEKATENYELLLASNGIDASQVEIAEANLKNAQLQLEKAKQDLAGATIISPMDGTVLTVNGAVGDEIDVSDGKEVIITIVSLEQPKLKVYVDETDLANFGVGCSAAVTFESLSNLTYTGTVTQISPSLVNVMGSSMAEGLVELDTTNAPSDEILPGLSASIESTCYTADDVLLVPTQALYTPTGDSPYVYVLNDQGQPEKREIEIGIQTVATTEVLSGIEEGEPVIISTVEE